MISFCKVKLVSFSLTEKLAKHSLGHFCATKQQ